MIFDGRLYDPFPPIGAVESTQKYYVAEEGEDVEISVTFNIVPEPAADAIAWEKLPG